MCGFIGIEEGHRGLDGGELWAEVGAEVFEHGVGEDGAVGGEEDAVTWRCAFGVFDETAGEVRLTGCELVVGHCDKLVMHGLGLGCDVFYGGSGAEDESVEGEGVDDEEFADVFGVGLRRA